MDMIPDLKENILGSKNSDLCVFLFGGSCAKWIDIWKISGIIPDSVEPIESWELNQGQPYKIRD